MADEKENLANLGAPRSAGRDAKPFELILSILVSVLVWIFVARYVGMNKEELIAAHWKGYEMFPILVALWSTMAVVANLATWIIHRSGYFTLIFLITFSPRRHYHVDRVLQKHRYLRRAQPFLGKSGSNSSPRQPLR